MKCRYRRISLLLALAGMTIAVAPQGAFAKEPADEDKSAKARRKAVEEMWWNDSEVVSHLTLSEDQRKNMDGQYRAYLETGPPRLDSVSRDAFVEALAAGDWDGAHARIDEMAEAAVVPLRAHGELKIRLLRQLSDEQRQRFVEKYPQLLRRPWVTRRADSKSRRRAAGKPK